MTTDVGPGARFILPVGVVTLLLAEIEASAPSQEAAREETTTSLVDYDGIFGEAIGLHGGVPPVEQGERGHLAAAFARASDAVGCAVELQRRLRPLSVQPRIGIHTGEAQLENEGSYVGRTVKRAARLRDAAHRGQVLLSRPTRDLVVDDLPAGASLRDLGEHRLKDLARPEHIYQLCHSEFGDEFPPLRSLSGFPNNLPVQLTSFVGRTTEIVILRRLVTETRLVTATGSGGSGKTRLALQVAGELVDEFPGGAWVVELASATSGDQLLSVMARAMSVREEPPRSLADSIAERIGSLRTLLVIDNCEHLVAECATVCETLLTRCSGLHVLATSRAALNAAGEVCFRVPSLSLPEPDHPFVIDALSRSEAVELFVERARSARHTFELSDDNAADVARICERVEGIPLALELAAARVRGMAVSAIASGLDDRFRLLTGGPRTAMPRQQTLRASVDWSHDLLDELDRVVFRRLAVFAGGFELEAAEQVTSGDLVDVYLVLDRVSRLVERSLLVFDEQSDPPRYRMLETVRQYALDQLQGAGEYDAISERHLHYYAGLLLATTTARSNNLTTREVEYHNALAALRWGHEKGVGEAVARLALAMAGFWQRHGPTSEGRAWFDTLLAGSDEADERVRALLLAGAGVLAPFADSIPYLQECLVLCRKYPDLAVGVATAAGHLGQAVGLVFGLEAARPLFEEAVAAAAEAGDHALAAAALGSHGVQSAFAGRMDSARALFARALQEAERAGGSLAQDARFHIAFVESAVAGQVAAARPVLEASIVELRSRRHRLELATQLLRMTAVYVWLGEYALAAKAVEELRLVCGALANPEFAALIPAMAAALVNLGVGDLSAARRGFETALGVAPQFGAFNLGPVLWGLCETLVRLEDVEAAAQRSDELAELVDQTGMKAFLAPALLTRGWLRERAGNLEAAERIYHDVLAHQMAMPSSRGVPEALERLAAIAADQGSAIEATRLLAGAQAERDRTGQVCFRSDAPALDALNGRLSERLGDRYEESWVEGSALSLAELVAYASRGRGDRKRPAKGWASLTPTETAVVDLVAEGLTNREVAERLFVSPRTVGAHLRSVFAKLDVSTRAQLTARAHRRQ